MSKYAIIALIVIALGLRNDFKKDKGKNRKAKIYHSILLSLLITSYAGSFGTVGWVIRNYDKIKTHFGLDIGVFSGEVHLVVFFSNLILSLVVLAFAFQMISRKESARKQMLFFYRF